MGNVVEYSPRGNVSNPSVGSGSGGGNVEDILKRLGNLETQVGPILTRSPHLATKADVGAIPYLATKADLEAVNTKVAAIETKIIKWIITTVLSTAALVFTIAKLVH